MWRNLLRQASLMKPKSSTESYSILPLLSNPINFSKPSNFSDNSRPPEHSGGLFSPKDQLGICDFSFLSNPFSFSSYVRGYASVAEALVSTEEEDSDENQELFEETTKKEKKPKLVGGVGQGKHLMLRRRQVKMETEAWEDAAKEYQELLADMCEQKLAPNLPYMKSLFLGWFEPLRDVIAKEQDLCKEGKNRTSYAPYFDHLPADMMAVITMHKLMALFMAGGGHGGARVVQAACQIGEAIEQEARIYRFLESTKKKNTLNKNPEEESDPVVKDEQKLRKKVNVLIKKQKVQQIRAIAKEHDDFKPWGQDGQVKVGCRLIQLLMESAYKQPPVEQLGDGPPDIRPAFTHYLKTLTKETQKFSRRYGVIECDPLVRKGLDRTARHMVIPYMPMSVPPVNWTGYDRGAYIFLPSYMMHTHGAKQQREAVKKTPKKQLESVFEALNTLGNKDMIRRLNPIVESGKSHVFNQNLKITQLGKCGRIEEATKIFNQMPHPNTVTYNSMISVYAKNGRINDARDLFDKMQRKTLVSWNTMIAGYLHNDIIDKARELFDKMTQRDDFTWTLMITCYTRNGEVEKARGLFDMLPDKKKKKNQACWNAMIAGYAKNRCFGDARKLFDEMEDKGLVSWNSMLAGYVQNGEMSLGLRFFEEMDERDVVSWNLMLGGFVEVGDLESAWQFFQRIPNPNIVSKVTMLCGFSRNGRITEAKRLFDQMEYKNVVSWNAMIAAYVQHCQIDEAVRLFRQMPEKNVVSWTTIINGYVRVGKLGEAEQVLNKMPYKNVGAQTAMISGYIQNRRMDEARQIFGKIGTPDVVCWNTMIAGYAHCGRMDEALNLLKQMPQKNIASWNSMIFGYAQTGQMDKAVSVFEEMGKKNIVSWNTLVSGYTQNCLFANALKTFLLMLQDGKKPDQSTFVSGLCSCANLAALEFGNQLHQTVVKSGYANNLSVSNALISMYAKCGRILSAEYVFKDIDSVDVISWNSLISGYASNGYGEKTIKLFQELIVKGVKPDEVTFVGVLSACSHSGLVDEGLNLFKSMTEEHFIEPLAEHYACMVSLLGRAGRLEEAFQMVREMKIEATAGIWGALLHACCVYGNLEIGHVATEKLSKLEPYKSSNYVLLSNLNADTGRWDEVESTRILMRDRGAEKQPGWSWILDRNLSTV
ncbi:hypothetical protein Vadar_009505 [Vaccinium darrowii]|uniref:Uncharacterized protein n=1 Tax=Vaccinium darrowii TaxID=229202 RepID=A0ACB7Y6Y7_9ERIC|nr:hypothetical protein Vadar_009505 [Vaccinium darrowii]